ncbi:beta glucosidase 17 [Prunus dulcis]|uniref:Beta glucosidase 17 n=1 Tax=Prunus dulcis TaxID=3755 RepID=A0A4Y1RM28_PRUDU|nr:beta glucosidase 17 [Prunus dulcis]
MYGSSVNFLKANDFLQEAEGTIELSCKMNQHKNVIPPLYKGHAKCQPEQPYTYQDCKQKNLHKGDIGATPTNYDTASLNRSSFPEGFIFGVGSAAYQYEGAAKEYGRGPSIWDIYTHKYPEKITDRSNGDIAVDQYHRRCGIMKNMGWDAYRFSISWSRLLPNGKLSGGVNKEGIKYYNNLINELLSNGEFDAICDTLSLGSSQTLEEEYGGFLSPRIIHHFQDYVELCYKEFGDRVKYWTTLNEPYTFSNYGYGIGSFAPGRCSAWQQLNCTGGDSSTEPYLVTHHLLLAHATAVKLYKNKYQVQLISISKRSDRITLVSHWFVPLSEETKNKNAALRALDFMFAEPLTSGDYPQSMRSFVGNRLPKFTEQQSKLLIGSFDFLGLNYYAGYYASDAPQNNSVDASYVTDARGASDWLNIYPRGIQDFLLYTKKKYHDPLIYVTENGVDESNDPNYHLRKPLMIPIELTTTIVISTINGVKVKGYFPWSLLDNFEWSSGYNVRFGITYVDYNDKLKRHPKLSAQWFKNFLKKH